MHRERRGEKAGAAVQAAAPGNAAQKAVSGNGAVWQAVWPAALMFGRPRGVRHGTWTTYHMAKETYHMAKETYHMAKETYHMAKETYPEAFGTVLGRRVELGVPSSLSQRLCATAPSLRRERNYLHGKKLALVCHGARSEEGEKLCTRSVVGLVAFEGPLS